MTLESGLVMADSRGEVERTAEIFEFAGAEARALSSSGELVSIDAVARGAGRIGLTRRFPVGVVLGITAFNAPLLLVAHKIAPAFAAGNPCIVRPAPRTPLSALALGAIMLEAGAPPEAVTVLPCSNELAERMVRDERVRMVSFTGSAPVGWYLKGVAATPRVTLELGGNGAVIVHSDADVAYAADRCALGGFLRAGQACISVQRLYAHSSIAGELRDALASRIAKLRTGDPRDEGVALGGLIDEPAAERAMQLIADAQEDGATARLRRHALGIGRRADAAGKCARARSRVRGRGIRADHRALVLRRPRRRARPRESSRRTVCRRACSRTAST